MAPRGHARWRVRPSAAAPPIPWISSSPPGRVGRVPLAPAERRGARGGAPAAADATAGPSAARETTGNGGITAQRVTRACPPAGWHPVEHRTRRGCKKNKHPAHGGVRMEGGGMQRVGEIVAARRSGALATSRGVQTCRSRDALTLSPASMADARRTLLASIEAILGACLVRAEAWDGQPRVVQGLTPARRVLEKLLVPPNVSPHPSPSYGWRCLTVGHVGAENHRVKPPIPPPVSSLHACGRPKPVARVAAA